MRDFQGAAHPTQEGKVLIPNENIYKTLLLARRGRYFVVQELCPEIVKIMSMFSSKEQIVLESRELSCYCWKVAKNYS